MFRLFVITALIGLSSTSEAADQPLDAEVVAVAYPKARSLRNTGVVVSAPGLVLGTAGVGLMATGAVMSSPCPQTQPDCGNGAVFMVVGGAVGLVASVPFLAAGLPMWVVGNKRVRANTAPSLTVRSTDAHGLGVGLVGRF